jgi:putative transposase
MQTRVAHTDLDAHFDAMLQLFIQFRVASGSGFVGHLPDQQRLSRWAARQRLIKRKGTLSLERTRRLELAGFQWERPTEGSRSSILDMLDCFIEYKKDTGYGFVGTSVKVLQTHAKLAVWAIEVRRRKKRGTLAPFEISALEDAGFVWENPHRFFGDNFEAKLEAFKDYRSATGLGFVGGGEREKREYPALLKWAKSIRAIYRHGTLPECHITELVQAGFLFEQPLPFQGQQSHKSFTSRLQQFKKYLEQTGSGYVGGSPSVCATYPGLQTWASKIRTRWRNGILSPDQVVELEQAGFLIENPAPVLTLSQAHAQTLEHNFYTRLQQFKDYLDQTGSGYVSASASKDRYPKLFNWADNIRRRHKTGQLPAWQIPILEQAGFLFSAPSRVEQFNEKQKIGVLKEAEPEMKPAEKTVSDAQRMEESEQENSALKRLLAAEKTVSDAQRVKELEQENSTLKRLLAESMLDNAGLKDLLSRK